MKITELPILTDCAVFRIHYRRRQMTAIPGRGFSSLSFRISGTTHIRSDGCNLVSGPDTLTYVPAGYAYRTESPENGEMIVMHFFAKQNCGDLPAVTQVPFPRALRNLFEAAEKRYTAKGCDVTLMSQAYQLLGEANAIFSPKVPIPPRIRDAKRNMDENLTDPSLRIRTLAESCGMSEAWFRREFEKYYGKSPLEYVKQKRVETAKLLLQSGLYTVTEVAFRSGFESSSYFSAEFRRLEGISPREYKNRTE